MDNCGYLYMLQCKDNTIYVGISHNAQKRIRQHQDGKGAYYTKERLPVTPLKVWRFPEYHQARTVERYLHKLSQSELRTILALRINEYWWQFTDTGWPASKVPA